jgi:hypothetical protein
VGSVCHGKRGQFAPESRGQFTPELGGLFHRNFQGYQMNNLILIQADIFLPSTF